MATVDDYIASLTPEDRDLFAHMSTTIKRLVPSVEQGTSYALPAFLYKGESLLAFVVRKSFFSLYPFSGKVIVKLEEKLRPFSTTAGAIHFTHDNPIPDALLQDLIETRIAEIEAKQTGKPKR